MNEIVLDTETTGLSVKEGHRIVEIGCIELSNRIPTSNTFHCFLNPERKVSEDALKVHGYTDKFLSDKSLFNDIADEFLNFIGDKKLIIHNATFDISHLNNELRIVGKKTLDMSRVIDTLEISREKFPGSQISLDALCKKFRIDNSKREKHNAVIDCELLAKVYVNLLNEKEPTLDFASTNQFNNVKINENLKVQYSKKIVKLSLEELNLHKKYLNKEIKKNYFN